MTKYPQNALYPGQGLGVDWGEGLRGLRVDKILRSQVQTPDETTFIIFFCFTLKYNGRGTQGEGKLGGVGIPGRSRDYC